MRDDFEEKLKQYMEGTLNPEEKEEVERELDRLEKYQEWIEREVDDSREIPRKNVLEDKKYRKALIKGKWKARFHNALTALAILIVITVISSIVSSFYYLSGTPPRIERYREIVQFSIATTYPNARMEGSGMEVRPFFTTGIKGNLQKRIGDREKKIGDIEGSFLFNALSIEPIKLYSDDDHPLISFDPSEERYVSQWERLEKIPEGTVAEAFVVFDRAYPTEEALKKFLGKNLQLLWLGVDIKRPDGDVFAQPIGFPHHPMWLEEDYRLESKEVEKGFLGSKATTELKSAPNIDDYGDGKLRNENFLRVLKYLQKYPKICQRVAPFTMHNLDEIISYVQKNGVKIYGMVVTGPSKEILKLKEEDWVRGVTVGEVDFWNMD